ncbi:MAG: hypothetical protein NT070_12335 [Cyanobacteria bacterium]|nr:hypothetical protein [Cyanobacteriota bacterium]
MRIQPHSGAIWAHGPKPETWCWSLVNGRGGSASFIEPTVKQVIASYFALRNALKDALDKKLRDEKKLNQ